MLIASVVLQLLLLIAVAVLLFRIKPSAEPDPRLAQLPDQFARLDTYVRETLAQIRSGITEEARGTRTENAAAATTLRTEVVGSLDMLGKTLSAQLATFNEENGAAAEKLRGDVEQRMRSLAQDFSEFRAEMAQKHSELRESTDRKLLELMGANTTQQETLRSTVEERLSKFKTELASFGEVNSNFSTQLRNDVIGNITTLGNTLKEELAHFDQKSTAASERLRGDVEQKMRSISQGFGDFKTESAQKHSDLQESLNRKLVELMNSNTAHQESLRSVVEERLTKLNSDNTFKLEEMRATVDEKLHATLHTRLTESFGQVTDQLNKVHTGLGEMSKLSEGVDGLSRIFTNVKSRGGVAEVLLGQLIAQILAPTQWVRNAQVKSGTQEVVEYAVRFPGAAGETLLPIDAKFPREDWERLETAYESGTQEEILAAGRAFEGAMRTEGKRICGKYINEPVTTPYAIMFLPTEALYAEVLRRDGLQSDLQQNCHVTVAGPSTLSAILISFQMGFHMLNVQKKGDDVWKILAGTRTEFEKFGDLMTSMEKQVGTVQNTIQKLGVRTRAIHRNLRDVSEVEMSSDNVLHFDGVATRLAAGADDE